MYEPKLLYKPSIRLEADFKGSWVPGFAGWHSYSPGCKCHAGESAGTVTSHITFGFRLPAKHTPGPACPVTADSRRPLKTVRLFGCRLVFNCCVTVSKQNCYIKAKRLFGKLAAAMRKGKLHTSALQYIDVLVLCASNAQTPFVSTGCCDKRTERCVCKRCRDERLQRRERRRPTWCFWKWLLWREMRLSAAQHERRKWDLKGSR